MASKTHGETFPGESRRYRTVRNRLLEAETELRRDVERVARMRRKLPLGGALKEDYVFDVGAGREVKLSELFREGMGHAADLQLHVRAEDAAAVSDVHVVSR